MCDGFNWFAVVVDVVFGVVVVVRIPRPTDTCFCDTLCLEIIATVRLEIAKRAFAINGQNRKDHL